MTTQSPVKRRKILPLGIALYYVIGLYVGKGYNSVSKTRLTEIINEFLSAFDKLGEIEIDQETYNFIKERIFND